MRYAFPIIALFLGFFPPLHAVDFNRDIRPILSDKCFACHGFDEKERKAKLRLDTAEGAFRDLGGYAAFAPGKLEESEAWHRIISDDEDEIMPPPEMHKPLSDREKNLIRKWIENGAEYKTHWSYAPLERKEESKIDDWINKDLAANGLSAAPKADKVTLIRRLYFDLLGLPPHSAAVDRFVADQSPGAYEKLVDSLLNHPAFGERLAVYWLDLVRYADTIGYHSDNHMEVSAYRDYVISAFNDNLPYDQFTIEQLAGDLLPNATVNQKIASGYNRLLQTTEEGGAQAEEYKVIYAADRVRNVSGVWLGSTIGCAQCHDHKYDPFSTRDFYTLAAFFADVKEKPIGKRQPNLKLPTREEEARIAELEKILKENTVPAVLARDAGLRKQIEKEQAAWEKQTLAEIASGKATPWEVNRPVKMVSKGKQKFALQKDHSILTSGRNPSKDDYRFELKGSGKITAFQLEALRHDSFPRKSLSRSNGNFVLTQVKVRQGNRDIKIARAAANYEQQGFPIANTLDGKDSTGWAADGHNDKSGDRQAMFVFETPVDLGDNGTLTIELFHRSQYGGHNIGRLRLSLTEAANPTISGDALPGNILAALKTAEEKRSDDQKSALAKHFQEKTPLLNPTRDLTSKTKTELDNLQKNIQTMLVSESLATPRMTRILNRGDWLDKNGEVVTPALPAFLPRDADLPTERRATRLDLAKWIMAESNPLTARTFVNRVWMLLFGEGISRNVDDLGGQGEPPTHPELLDVLALQFRESGWDIKALFKSILMSDAYQRSSVPTDVLRTEDPTNLLWGRQGRWRIEAEFVRDTGLKLSGLLVEKMGGKSVKPYQPAGYWQHLNFPRRKWESGKGEDLYRRGIYTFLCRSFPHPSLVAFDAPSREECTSKRSRSNIPQQALVLLNDPIFVEIARKFGERAAKHEGNREEKMAFAWKEATGRKMTTHENDVLSRLFASQFAKYTNDEAAAKQLLETGASPRDESISLSEAAAWTQVCRAILNTYETTSRN